MTKEEQIEEIAGIIFESEIDDGIAFCDVYELGFTERIGRNLIEKGYRKADEVRAETAREILTEFKDIHWGQSEMDNVFIRLSEKYGVLWRN